MACAAMKLTARTTKSRTDANLPFFRGSFIFSDLLFGIRCFCHTNEINRGSRMNAVLLSVVRFELLSLLCRNRNSRNGKVASGEQCTTRDSYLKKRFEYFSECGTSR